MSESDQPLIAQCPSCQTRFRVTAEQLAVADGRVRCGACLSVFDGRAASVTETSAVADDPLDVLLDEPAPALEPPGRAEFPAEDIRAEIPTTRREAPEPTSDKPPHPAFLATAIAAALALLATGILVLQYQAYAHDPVLREAYEIVGVDLPAYRALDAIRVDNATVGERSGAPDELIVRLDLANTAPRYQRFPTLAVRFFSADGDFLAEQRVEPAAYLPSPTHTRRMTPNRPVAVRLRLDDPGRDAASYAVSLL